MKRKVGIQGNVLSFYWIVELSKKEKKKVEKDQDKEFKARKKELKELKVCAVGNSK